MDTWDLLALAPPLYARFACMGAVGYMLGLLVRDVKEEHISQKGNGGHTAVPWARATSSPPLQRVQRTIEHRIVSA